MRILKRFGASFHTRVGSFVFFALAAIAFFFLRSASWAYGWIAEYYPLGEAFVPTVMVLIAVCAVFALVFLLLPARRKENRTLRIIHTVVCVLSGVLFAYTTILAFGVDQGIALYRLQNGWNYLWPYLPALGLAVGAPFAFVVFPRLKKKAQVITALVLTVALSAAVIAPFVVRNLPFEFSTNPLVLDIGDGYYSVVFATNRDSVGYLVYVFDGDEIVVANAFAGAAHMGRVHNFQVPRAQFDGSTFHVVAREVLSMERGYLLNLSAEIQSPAFQFRGHESDELNILLASDWHGLSDKLVAVSEYFPQPDLLVMLGDVANGLHSEDDFIRHIIWAGAEVTGSVVPAIFARGNHDARGAYASHVFPGLGLRSFYYQVQRGNILFTVIDSAEDWSARRMADGRDVVHSQNAAHLNQQIDWLAQLEPPEEGQLHFAVVHIPLSGHWHGLASQFFPANYEHARFQVPHSLFFAGGPTDGYTGDVRASMVQVRADGTVRLLGYISTGVQTQDRLW